MKEHIKECANKQEEKLSKKIIHTYAVWYDLRIGEYFGARKRELNQIFLDELRKDKTEIKYVFAKNTVDAINLAYPERKISNFKSNTIH